jgi:ATP-dependent Zn protease
MKKEYFSTKDIIKLEDLEDNTVKKLSVSDLCIQTDTHLIQFELKEDKDKKRKKTQIKPGCFNFVPTQMGLVLDDFTLKNQDLLESIDNTSSILNEAGLFFSKLDVYEKLEIEKKRALLLYGEPGTGKSSGIIKVCKKFLKEDNGTVVINWNSAVVESSDVLDFLSSGSVFTKKCTRLILIIEDIGSERESHYGPRSVDRSLLNLLDGIGINFNVPTFIIATTNYAANLPKNLANRPGRFDKMIEIGYPSAEERVGLLKFISKRNLTEEEELCIKSKSCNDFSIAHLKEIIIRSQLNNKSIAEVVKEIKEHSKKFNKSFDSNSGSLGL